MLSDACADFIQSFAENAKTLAEQVHWYSSPDNPLRYGAEVDALRRASMAVADNPYDVKAGAELLRLAESIRSFYDTLPHQPEIQSRKSEMLALVKILGEVSQMRTKRRNSPKASGAMTLMAKKPLRKCKAFCDG